MAMSHCIASRKRQYHTMKYARDLRILWECCQTCRFNLQKMIALARYTQTCCQSNRSRANHLPYLCTLWAVHVWVMSMQDDWVRCSQISPVFCTICFRLHSVRIPNPELSLMRQNLGLLGCNPQNY